LNLLGSNSAFSVVQPVAIPTTPQQTVEFYRVVRRRGCHIVYTIGSQMAVRLSVAPRDTARLEGLDQLKNLTNRDSNPRPSGLKHSATTNFATKNVFAALQSVICFKFSIEFFSSEHTQNLPINNSLLHNEMTISRRNVSRRCEESSLTMNKCVMSSIASDNTTGK
jgi:hypothetical protein